MFSNFTTTKKPNKSLVFPQPVGLTLKSATTPRFTVRNYKFKYFLRVSFDDREWLHCLSQSTPVYTLLPSVVAISTLSWPPKNEGTNAANFITFVRNFNAFSIRRNQQRSGDTLDEKSALKIPLTTRLDNEKMNLSLEVTTTTT